CDRGAPGCGARSAARCGSLASAGAGLHRRARRFRRARVVIETERLLIRPLEGNEHEELLAIWRDPPNERVTTTDETRIRRWLELVWGVWERETGELVGDCSLHFDDTFQDWELSYGFRRDRWGRGYATEAARA